MTTGSAKVATRTDWTAVALQATTLHERLAAAGSSTASSEADRALAARDLARLRRAVSPHDPGALARRLSWDGRAESDVLKALQGPSAPTHPSAWTTWAEEVLEAAEKTSFKPLVWPADTEGEPPFIELWMPFAVVAQRAVEETIGALWGVLDDEVKGGLVRPLLKQLARQAELAAYERFQAAREAGGAQTYKTFIGTMLGEGGLREMLSAYPVLARQLVTRTLQWTSATTEVLSRFDADAELLRATFGWATLGEIDSIRAGLSDPHEDGRSVAILKFATGRQLVYKPRQVSLERAVHRLLAWLSAEGLEHAPPSLRILDRHGYGWVEYAQHGGVHSREQAEYYFEAAGSLMCVAYLLNIDDLHCQNIVATAGGPVLVDVEAALQPVRPDVGPLRDLKEVDGASSLATGLLSWIHVDSDGLLFDVGGLQPQTTYATLLPTRRWLCLRSDDLHYVKAKRSPTREENVIELHGNPLVPEDYPGAMLSGFARTYRFLMSRRERLLEAGGVLSELKDAATRVIFRPSGQYGALLYLLAAPRYQQRGVDASIAIETLNRSFSLATEKPGLWPLADGERRSLEAMDVPRFLVPVHGTDIVGREGQTSPGYFSRSGFDAVAARLRGLSEDDLRWQMRALEAALRARPGAAPGVETAEERLVEAARILGEEILTAAERRGPHLFWPTLSSHGENLRGDLYDGQAGVGVFLAALSAVTQDHAWVGHARAALSPLDPGARAAYRLRFDGVGIASGTGSAAYALILASQLLEDASWLDLAVRLGRDLGDDRAEGGFDVVAGLAGAVLALLCLHDATGQAWALEKAAQLGRALVERQVETGPGRGGWLSPDGLIQAGFGHGAAGAAYALLRLHRSRSDRSFVDAARRAIAHERTLFSPVFSNWPVVEKNGIRLMMGWCHGAPGIGLARGLVRAVVHDSEIDEEIQVAAESVRSAPRSFDHLCCGDLSRSEMLLSVGQILHRDDWTAEARALATNIADRVFERGRLNVLVPGYAHRQGGVGLFQGLAGVGYQLLRAAFPERVPSILAFDLRH